MKENSYGFILRYVELPYLCFTPEDRTKHFVKGCDVIDGDQEGSDLVYGDWLRASGVKAKRCDTKVEKLDKGEKKNLLGTQEG